MFDQEQNAPVEDIFASPAKTAPAPSGLAFDSRPASMPPMASQLPPSANQMPSYAPLPVSGIDADNIFGGKKINFKKIMFFAVIIAAIGGAAWGATAVWQKMKNAPASGFLVNVNVNRSVNSNTNTGNADINANSANTNVNTNNTNTNVVQPATTDSDSDGLTDTEEKAFGTDAKSYDTDRDGLNDGAEIKVFKTNPLNPDTDSDGYKDGEEVINGYDPNKPGSARLFQAPPINN